MNKQILIGIIAAIVLIGGVALYVSRPSDKNTVQNSSQSSESMMPEDKMKTDDAMMKDEDDMMKEEDVMMKDDDAMEKDSMKKNGTYKDYSQETVDAEQKAGNKVVLFFHAPWCPDCKAADSSFKSNLDKIPAGVTLLKTDYDSNTELKKKYAVTHQHTFVQINDDESLVTKWVSGDVDMLIKNIK